MPEYRTPLPAMLASFLEAASNRVLALDDASIPRMERLSGKTLELNLEGLEIVLYFSFEYGNVRVELDSEQEPDTRVSGSPVALFAMAAPEEVGNWGLPSSSVQISGDAALARDLGTVFNKLRPDWESPLASVFGDVLGFQIASGIRQGSSALQEAARATFDMSARYLRDESDALASKQEVSQFNRAVDELRDSVDRLEARIRREEQASS
jgi:ubiquinone biosynthesis protein UbiJ